MKQYLLKVWMTAALSLLVVGGVWGQAAPTVVSLSPADGATGVDPSTDFSVTFTEDIRFNPIGTFHYSIYEPSAPFPVAYGTVEDGVVTQGSISISGSVLNLSFPGLEYSSSYYIVVSPDAIQSLGGIGFVGIAANEWSLTMMAEPSNLLYSSLSPVDGATGVDPSSNFSVTFTEDIRFNPIGTFHYSIYESGTPFPYAYGTVEDGVVTRGSISISGSVLNLSFAGLEYSKSYYIVVSTDAIQSLGGVGFVGIAANEWLLTMMAEPSNLLYSSLSPVDGATGVDPSTDFSVTFTEDIRFNPIGTFHYSIYEPSAPFPVAYGTVEDGVVTQGSISISGSVLNLSFPGLEYSSSYYIVVSPDAIQSLGGIGFVGIAANEWSLTMMAEPSNLLYSSLSPVDGATGVDPSSNFSVTFTEDIRFNPIGTFHYSIYESGTPFPYAYGTVEDGVVTRGSISISGSVLNLSFAGLEYSSSYYIVVSPDAIQSLGGVGFVGIAANEWSFTTEVEPDPLLMNTSSLSPENSSVEVPRAPTLEVSFNQAITWGPSGVLTIHRYDNDATVATISPGETGATISQDKLSIIFSSDRLEYGTKYYVIIDEGFVKALNTSAVFPGLSEKTVWSFTTETAPPFWEEGYPSITNQTIDGFVFNAWADQEGVFYGVVTLNSSPPTVEDIEQGLNGSARISFNEAVDDITIPTSITVLFNSNTALGNTYFLHVVYKAGGKYSEVATLQVDRVVPEVLSSNPAEGTIVFPVTESIEILFSEEVVGIDGDSLDANHFSFELKEIIPVDFSISVVTESEMTKVVLTPTTALIEDTTYTITISEVYDLSGNPSDPVSITFETDGVSTWTGGGNSSDWSDPQNWGGVDFVQYKSVVISSLANTYPEITKGIIDVHNLTIQPGAVLTHTGGTLNVTGLFTLESSVDVNGSYINSGAVGAVLNVEGGNVNVEQVINNIDLSYVISSPTDGSTADNFGGYYPLYYYENSSDSWQPISFSSAMTSGVGYRMWTDDTMVNFSGDFNIGSVLVSLSRTDGQGYGWNFVGNPYPAAIDWNLLNVTEESTIEDNFWMWMPTQKSYGSYSASTGIAVNIESSKIPSNHGFLVKVKQGLTSGSLEFLPSAQVANDAMYLKSASSKPLTSHFKLAGISAEGFRDEFAVAFVDGAVEGVDRYDMEKRFANQRHLFELFSLSGSLKSVINSVPNVGFIEIPLGYNALQTGTVGVELVNSNLEDAVVILVDELTDEETVLEEGGRVDVFISQKGVVNDRFKLRVSRVVTSDASIVVTEEQNSRIRVVVKDRNIHLFLSEPGSYEGFMICDVQGRVIRSGALSGAQFESLGSFSDGVYLIQLFNSEIGSVENVKVVVY